MARLISLALPRPYWLLLGSLLACLGLGQPARAQPAGYRRAYDQLHAMLAQQQPPDFAKAVFLVENAWYDHSLSYPQFQQQLVALADKSRELIAHKQAAAYRTAPNWALFMLLTQPLPENDFQPYKYDFEDFTGTKDYASTFVTRLLRDHKGNCLSLPLLYKCLAQQLGAQAQLTIGPSHAWIRHLDEKGAWTNVELTSGQFPSDGLLMTELGVSTEAIRSGAYGKELTEPQALAFLLTQLALGYQRKTGRWDAFTDQCADLSLHYYTANVAAYMIKANRATMQAQRLDAANPAQRPQLRALQQQFEAHQTALRTLGAGNIPAASYQDWVKSMQSRPTN